MIGQKGIPATQGGVERHAQELSTRLVQFGHNVTVYARKWYTQKNADFVFEGVNVKHLNTLHTKHFDTITHSFLATIDAIRNKMDVIHYHGVGPSLVSWIPRIFAPKIKVITTFHSIDRYHAKWNFLAKMFLRIGEWTACKFPHQTITISKSLEQYCINEFNTETHYVPNAFDPKEITTENAEISKFGLASNEYILMVSRLVPHKGAHFLIEAFNKLKAENHDNEKISKLKLAIVGGSAYTDEYIKKLHTLASKNNQIIFTDIQAGKTMEELYSHTKLLVHPSENEGLPFSVLEAMSYSKPVLVSNIPEHLELLEDPKVIFTNRDVDKLKEKLFDLLMLDDEKLQNIGARNKGVIEDNYTWNQALPKITELYEANA